MQKDGEEMPDNLIKLHESKLWKTYAGKMPGDERRVWVEKIYATTIEWLKEVPKTFPNYTLHDETHVLNVMEAMAGLLGNQIDMLSLGECELLILAATLHDIGMVYTDEAIRDEANNLRILEKYLRDKLPEKIGCSYDDLQSEDQQDYLRSRHPFRLPKLLEMTIPTEDGKRKKFWDFEGKPIDIAPKEIIIAVCQSHGEGRNFLESDRLNYLSAPRDIDPRFCALLLRLGDILDFDGSRAPEILSIFAQGIKRSEDAYAKHHSSGGFSFPNTPTNRALGYCAECDDPEINFKLREYLDWVDQEFLLANELTARCKKDWQRAFPFPREVAKGQISTVNFDSAPFSVTMDQEQILKLLTGQNLYNDKGVFLRELLQNAIDATLLRGKMDSRFDVESEEAAIYFWSGVDKNDNYILRVDDHGTGMTRAMLHRYFLKVGRSYYQSEELKRDLLKHGCREDYHGISHFGIGFLSCFLYGISAEVSTLYFDEHKCNDENDYNGDAANGFGLRAVIPKLTGHYALHNQALHHHVQATLPIPNGEDGKMLDGLEYNGYRQKPGTSIVVTLDPSKLGILDLKEELEKYLCAPRMPIYFNGKRIGRTYQEMMREAHRLATPKMYELSTEEKKLFDRFFPESQGNYPRLSATVELLEPKTEPKIEGFSMITIRRELLYTPQEWQVKDQRYILDLSKIEDISEKGVQINGTLENVTSYQKKRFSYASWESLKTRFSAKAIKMLGDAFSCYDTCPRSCKQLGDIWHPFSRKISLQDAWVAFVDSCAGLEREHTFWAFRSAPLLNCISGNRATNDCVIAFQGVLAGRRIGNFSHSASMLSYLEGQQQPSVDIGRSNISSLPEEVELVLCAVAESLSLGGSYIKDTESRNLASWRALRNSKAGSYVMHRLQDRKDNLQRVLQMQFEKAVLGKTVYSPHQEYEDPIVSCFLVAALQDSNEIHICYEEGGLLRFASKPDQDESPYDAFPPMPFCLAASKESRRYLCAADRYYRRGVTADHWYVEWMLENDVTLIRDYPAQFERIMYCLWYCDAKEIIQEANAFRAHLVQQKTLGKTCIDLPEALTGADFWNPS